MGRNKGYHKDNVSMWDNSWGSHYGHGVLVSMFMEWGYLPNWS